MFLLNISCRQYCQCLWSSYKVNTGDLSEPCHVFLFLGDVYELFATELEPGHVVGFSDDCTSSMKRFSSHQVNNRYNYSPWISQRIDFQFQHDLFINIIFCKRCPEYTDLRAVCEKLSGLLPCGNLLQLLVTSDAQTGFLSYKGRLPLHYCYVTRLYVWLFKLVISTQFTRVMLKLLELDISNLMVIESHIT